MSTIPMMAITQGKPMDSAMEPPMDGPGAAEDKPHLGHCLHGSETFSKTRRFRKRLAAGSSHHFNQGITSFTHPSSIHPSIPLSKVKPGSSRFLEVRSGTCGLLVSYLKRSPCRRPRQRSHKRSRTQTRVAGPPGSP